MAKKALVSPTGRPQKLRPIHPNAGLTATYQRRLDALIAEMHASVTHWVLLAYKQRQPHSTVAMDASPAAYLRKVMAALTSRWTKRFNDMAPKLGRYFAEKASESSTASLRTAMKDAGFTVTFQNTKAVNDIFQATLHEQVNLVRSIPKEHLAKVASLVNRSVQKGGDLGGLAKDLEEQFGITQRRARTISLSQNSIATATIARARALEIGVTRAIWQHSSAGKTPRPSHVAFSGKEYSIAEGVVLDGERVWPGTAIFCRCYFHPILASDAPGDDEEDGDDD